MNKILVGHVYELLVSQQYHKGDESEMALLGNKTRKIMGDY